MVGGTGAQSASLFTVHDQKSGIGLKKWSFRWSQPKADFRGGGSARPGVLPLAWGDVEERADARAIACPVSSVAPALESGRALSPGRYRPYYRLPLGSVCGSEVSYPDWSI
jgi:hypothetical protein